LTAAMVFLLIAQAAMAVHINEVMYNPPGNDNNREFVEVYLENNQSLENWTISDSESGDMLKALNFVDSSYALIVEDGYDYQNSGASYYSAGATIGNNLNNDLDEVKLYDASGSLVDSMSYDGSMANNNNRSLEYFNGSWFESAVEGGTPGAMNSIPESHASLGNISNSSTVQDDTNASGNAGVIYNGTGNSTSAANQTHDDTCSINISISSARQLYGQDEKISYRISLNDTSRGFVIEYWVEDLYGRIVKKRYNTTNTNMRSWTPPADRSAGAYIIMARLAYVNCTMENMPSSSLLVAVRGDENPTGDEDTDEKKQDSELRIEKIYLGTDNSAKSGETVLLKIYAYRGNTAKSVVQVYAEDESGKKASEVSKITLSSRYSDNTVTIPLKLDCDDNDDTEYTIIATGLGEEDRMSIRISGTAKECQGCSETSTECGDCPVQSRRDEHPRIRSFYTLSRKYSPRINLFATVEPASGSELLLVSSRENIQKQVNSSSKVSFDAAVADGNNTFFLALLNNGTVVDMKKLDVGFNSSAPLEIPAVQANDSGQAMTGIADEITAYATAQPQTVYESSGEKSKGRIKYLFAALGCILAGIIIWKRH